MYHPGGAFAARAGECINTPRNVPHTECVTSAGPARVLDMSAPSFDEFVAAAGQPTLELTLPPPREEPSDLDRLAVLAAEHETAALDDPV